MIVQRIHKRIFSNTEDFLLTVFLLRRPRGNTVSLGLFPFALPIGPKTIVITVTPTIISTKVADASATNDMVPSLIFERSEDVIDKRSCLFDILNINELFRAMRIVVPTTHVRHTNRNHIFEAINISHHTATELI